jgi:hypothetical protein
MRYTAQKLGGRADIAQSYGQTVVGIFNNIRRSSVAMDFTTQPILLPRGNDPLFIVGNGTSASARSNAYYIANGGHAVVTADNRKDMITPNFSKPAIKGARYIDNTPAAWGRVNEGGTLVAGFGVDSIFRDVNGGYLIWVKYIDPETGAQIQTINGSSVTATIEGTIDNYTCKFITTSPLQYDSTTDKYKFRVWISQHTTSVNECAAVNSAFSFAVFLRP